MSERPFDAKRVGAWCLYDFANSTFSAVITATVFSVYYTKVVVGNDDGAGDLWWSVAVAISTTAVALSSPIMGAVADRSGARRLLLAVYTGVSVLAITSFVTIDPGDVVLGCLLFIVANFGMEGAIVFYNAYLTELVPRSWIGRVSSWGFGVGYLGSIVGLLAALPLVTAENFDAVWLLVAALFGGFALPSLLILGPGGRREMSIGRAAIQGWTHVRQLVGEVLALPRMRRFLLAYFLYANGVFTGIYFAGPIAEKTFGFAGNSVIILFVVVQASALIGAFAMARPTDQWGPKRVVNISLVLWLIAVALIVFAPDAATNEALGKTLFWAASVVAGLGLGTVQSASRALMATLIPEGREDEFFGFYALCGKSSAPLGMLTFGVLSWTTSGDQQLAIGFLALYLISGFLLLRRVDAGGPTITPAVA